MKKLFIIALSFTTFSVSAQITENSIVTDRPSQAESPKAVGKGIIQIESGLFFERREISRGFSQHRNVYPINLFRIGVANRVELRVVNEIVTYKTIDNSSQEETGKVSGTENLQIGLKYQVTNDAARIAVGVVSHAILPTGSTGVSNKRYGIVSRVNISYDLAENKNVSANFGYNNFNLDFNEEGLVRYGNGDFTYTFIYGFGLSERVGLYAEAFGNYVEFEDFESNINAGMTYLISDNVQLDYSYGMGLNRVMNYHSIGISVRLPK